MKNKRLLAVLLVICLASTLFNFPISAQSTPVLALSYDDYYTFEGASSVSSNNTAIIKVSENTIHAVGITADTPVTVTADGTDFSVTVKKAKVNLVAVCGQSNACGSNGGVDATQLAKYTLPTLDYGTAYYWGSGATAPSAFKDDWVWESKGFVSGLAKQWYEQTVEAGDPQKIVAIYEFNYTGSSGQSLEQWCSDDYAGGRHDKTAEMVNACYDYYTKGAGKNYYEVVDCGMYWLQGEADANKTTKYYYDTFSSVWAKVKAETENRLKYCSFMRVRGTSGSAYYNGPIVAQYQLANDFDDIYMATEITEKINANVTDYKNSYVEFDISKYDIFDDPQYASVIEGGILKEQVSALYGGVHYSRLGYTIIGADAAYNMYRTRQNLQNALTVGAGGLKNGVTLSATGGSISQDDIVAPFLIYSAMGSGIKTVTLKSIVCQGTDARDITAAVWSPLTENSNSFLINNQRLLNYVDPVITLETELGEAVITVDTTATENPDPFGETLTDAVYYHWDFTNASSYKKGLTDGAVNNTEPLKITTAPDSLAYGMMEYYSSANTDLSYSAENGITRSSTDPGYFMVYNKDGQNGIVTTLTNGFAIEVTATLAYTSSKTSFIFFGNKTSTNASIHPYMIASANYFTMGGATPSLSFNVQNKGVDFTKELTYRVESLNGTDFKLTVTQGDLNFTVPGTVTGTLSDSFFTWKQFMPNFSDGFNFKGSVKDVKLYTSYCFDISYSGSSASTYTVSGLENNAFTAKENRFAVTGNGIFSVKSVKLNGKELTPDVDGYYTVLGLTDDAELEIITEATLDGHTVDAGTVIKQATCESAGIRKYCCIDEGCDFCYEEEIPALGHNMDSGNLDIAPTANNCGAFVYRCKNTGCSYKITEYKSATKATYYHWDFTDKSTYDTSNGYVIKTARDSEAISSMSYMSASTSILGYDSLLGLVRNESSRDSFKIYNKDGTIGIPLSVTNGFALEFTAAINTSSGFKIILSKSYQSSGGGGHPLVFTSGTNTFAVGGVAPATTAKITKAGFDITKSATYRYSYNNGIYHIKITQNGIVYFDSDVTMSAEVPETHFTFGYLFPHFNDDSNFKGSISDLKFWTDSYFDGNDVGNFTEDFQNWYAEDHAFISQIAAIENEAIKLNSSTNSSGIISKPFTAPSGAKDKQAVVVFDYLGTSGGSVGFGKSGASGLLDLLDASSDWKEFVSSGLTLEAANDLFTLRLAGNDMRFKNIRVMYKDSGDTARLVNTDGTPYKFAYGDVNCDSKINLLDFVRMKKKLAGVPGTVAYLAAANVTKKADVSLTADDLTAFTKFLLGETLEF